MAVCVIRAHVQNDGSDLRLALEIFVESLGFMGRHIARRRRDACLTRAIELDALALGNRAADRADLVIRWRCPRRTRPRHSRLGRLRLAPSACFGIGG